MTTIERYIIELENEEFGFFHQTSDCDVQVMGVSESEATMFTKKQAGQIVEEMNGNSKWKYYGGCLEAKGIRKVTLIFGED